MTNGIYINRRRMLQLFGGASVLLSPILRARIARAAGDLPKRIIFVFTPNGFHQSQWWPEGSETSFSFPQQILQPLTPHIAQTTIVSGLRVDYQREDGSLVKGGSQNGNHEDGMTLFLTNTSRYGSTRFASGVSIDQVIANQIAGQTKFKSLEIGCTIGNDGMGYASYDGPGQPRPVEQSVVNGFNRCFSGFTPDPNQTDQERQRILLEKKSVLDFVVADINAMKKELTAEEKYKLDAHMTSIREIERGLSSQASLSQCTVPAKPVAATDAGSTVANLRAQSDLIVSAMACDLTRVATMVWTRCGAHGGFWSQDFEEPIDHHAASHYEVREGQTIDPAKKYIEMGKMFGVEVAHLVNRLKSIPEGSGTMLDNTVIFWGSEIAAGAHDFQNMPYVLIGSCGGKIKTGRFLKYENKYNHSGLLIALANAMGASITTFGNPNTTQTGPLPNLLV